MATEIERRFLVRHDLWQSVGRALACEVSTIQQGFLSTTKERVVRVRVVGERGVLTIKGLTRGFSKTELEYAIPVDEARLLLDELCEQPLIEKIRYRVQQGGVVWEVDQFLGVNQGLWLAEVELAEAHQAIELPVWVGQEISDDPRYFNTQLSLHPFTSWGN